MRWFKPKPDLDSQIMLTREVTASIRSLAEAVMMGLGKSCSSDTVLAKSLAYVEEISAINPRCFDSQVYDVLRSRSYGHEQLFDLIRALCIKLVEDRRHLDRLDAECRQLKKGQ